MPASKQRRAARHFLLKLGEFDWRAFATWKPSYTAHVRRARSALSHLSNPEIDALAEYIMVRAQRWANGQPPARGLDDVSYTRAEELACCVLLAAAFHDGEGVDRYARQLARVRPATTRLEAAYRSQRAVLTQLVAQRIHLANRRRLGGQRKRGKRLLDTEKAAMLLPAIVAHLGEKASAGNVLLKLEAEGVCPSLSTVKTLLKALAPRAKKSAKKVVF